MDIPKTLKEVISNIPEVIDENTIELTITEKWEVLKSNLLSTKESIENHINNRQDVVNKIDEYLIMLGVLEPNGNGGESMGITLRDFDPSSNDWILSDLIADSNWHDLDCSNIVPVGTKAINFHMGLREDVTVGLYARIRKKGQTNDKNALFICSIVPNPNGTIYSNGWVACDADRKCEYRINPGITALHIIITGWQE